jgi:hypothetical protein
MEYLIIASTFVSFSVKVTPVYGVPPGFYDYLLF